jgi:putative oxidoreductase
MSSIIQKAAGGYRFLVTAASWVLQPLLLLAIRLCWGWQFYLSGLGKYKTHDKVVEFFGSLGIPFPELNAWLVATTECVGGILLLMGLASRLVSIPLMTTMIVAYATADRESLGSLDDFLGATPFQFLLATLLILAFGPGVLSIDYLIKRFVLRRRSPDQSPNSQG